MPSRRAGNPDARCSLLLAGCLGFGNGFEQLAVLHFGQPTLVVGSDHVLVGARAWISPGASPEPGDHVVERQLPVEQGIQQYRYIILHTAQASGVRSAATGFLRRRRFRPATGARRSWCAPGMLVPLPG